MNKTLYTILVILCVLVAQRTYSQTLSVNELLALQENYIYDPQRHSRISATDFFYKKKWVFNYSKKLESGWLELSWNKSSNGINARTLMHIYNTKDLYMVRITYLISDKEAFDSLKAAFVRKGFNYKESTIKQKLKCSNYTNKSAIALFCHVGAMQRGGTNYKYSVSILSYSDYVNNYREEGEVL